MDKIFVLNVGDGEYEDYNVTTTHVFAGPDHVTWAEINAEYAQYGRQAWENANSRWAELSKEERKKLRKRSALVPLFGGLALAEWLISVKGFRPLAFESCIA